MLENEISEHWLYYFYTVTHFCGILISTKIAEYKNRLSNRIYLLVAITGLISILFVAFLKKNKGGRNSYISVYNYLVVCLVVVVLFWLARTS